MATSPLIVPDTNVLISGVRRLNTPPCQIIEAWRQGQIQLATSETILAEVERVFLYPRVQRLLHFTPQQIQTTLSDLREGALIVSGNTPVALSPDPTDNKFFACAIEAQADYLVSGDQTHVLSVGTFAGVQTISPADFVRKVLMDQKAA